MFANPAFIAEYNVDPEISAILGVMEDTGKDTGMPRRVARHITISKTALNEDVAGYGYGGGPYEKSERFWLKGEDLSALQRVVARQTTANFRDLRLTGTPEEQLEELKGAVNAAADSGREWFARNRARGYLKEANRLKR